jgi:hypothetical protein
MKQDMPMSVLTTWRLLDRLGEFGERRMDLRFAKLTMHLVACLRDRKSGPVRLGDMLLKTIDDKDEWHEPDPERN